MNNPEDQQEGQQPGAAEARAFARGAAALPASPRLVTTGGKNGTGNPVTGPENPEHQQGGEKLEFVAIGNRRVRHYLRPLPDDSVSEHVAHIDWLALTVTPPEGESPLWLIQALLQFLPIKSFTPTGKGWNGYKQRHTITGMGDADLGLFAFGGDSQRGSVHVELNAQACALITDWSAIQAWGEQHYATITRLDLAHDDMAGKTVSVDIGLEWLQAGRFTLNGRPAKARLIDDLGTGDGKTLYVGQRANGKMLRIYEKGKQLGDSGSPWVRVEVELRNKSRLIPWDALTRPGQYLAGAYPCLAYLSAMQEKIKTITKSVKISLKAAIEHLHQTGGKLIHVMMQVHSGDAFAVVNELKREGIPRRLTGYAAFLPDVLCEVET